MEGFVTAQPDAVASIAQSVTDLRRRQRRSTLAGQRSTAEVHAAEVADVVAADTDTIPTVGDIARELTLDPSHASRRVSSAIGAGLLERVSLQHDGRLSGLRLTADGRRVVAEVQQRRRRLVERATGTWTLAERTQLARLLRRFVDALEQTQPD